MFSKTLLTTLLLALTIAADPVVVKRSPVTLPISRRVNLANVRNIVRHDQTRAKALKAGGAAGAANLLTQNNVVVNEQVNNTAVIYVASVGVGSPATTYLLAVDTGSSNTWVGAARPYVKTRTSNQTSNSVFVGYGTGSFSGTEFTDQVTIAPGLVIPKQSIGVASTSFGFSGVGVDGILGIGPVNLTLGSLFPATNSLIPTVTDNSFSGGVINANEIGISFEPNTASNSSNANGELTWGGTDSSKFTGAITFTPITTASRASKYWGIDQSIRYGASTSILATTAGIVDTGTTLILIATDGFNNYKTATGAELDKATGLLRITPTQFSKLQSLFFTIGGVAFELTANAQLWPRSLNTDIGGTAGSIYLIVNDIGSVSGQGFDFISGFGFLERFYSVFDTANKRVGFATTPFTNATTN